MGMGWGEHGIHMKMELTPGVFTVNTLTGQGAGQSLNTLEMTCAIA